MTKDKELPEAAIAAAKDSAVAEAALIEIAAPPAVLTFESLCHLYGQYVGQLVSGKHKCPRGVQVVFEDYHFFHLVKLTKGFQTAFKMVTEKENILACKDGFGEYKIDANREAKLAWIPELISDRHEIYESEESK